MVIQLGKEVVDLKQKLASLSVPDKSRTTARVSVDVCMYLCTEEVG